MLHQHPHHVWPGIQETTLQKNQNPGKLLQMSPNLFLDIRKIVTELALQPKRFPSQQAHKTKNRRNRKAAEQSSKTKHKHPAM
jgi:hypothetical protein